MDRLIAELCAAWPETRPDAPGIRTTLEGIDVAALDGPHRADLLLASACLVGNAAALAAFHAGPVAAARVHLRALGLEPAEIEDAVQTATTRLIVDGGLATYRGRGPLSNYVRTIAVRYAFQAKRKVQPSVALDIADVLASPCPDPELEYMRKLYAVHLADAIRDAWRRLGPHERFILSLQIHEGMTIDDLAAVYSIHRASAARRAAAARSALIETTRACLRDRLEVTDATLDSILRIVTTSVRLPIDTSST